MKWLKYNNILDKVGLYEGLKTNTLTIRLEGSIGEDCPSDRHRYDISCPVELGAYIIDFSSYRPRNKYELIVKRLDENSIDITFNGKDYTLHEGINYLFEVKEYQASYDGPWFTAVDEFMAVWVK